MGEEKKAKLESLAREFLETVGEDPERHGLEETPQRWARMWTELLEGYEQDPSGLFTVFEEEHSNLIALSNIRFSSMCEHHLLPFYGTAHVGYYPSGRVVGVSKLSRVVHVFAHRLQLQERLTWQVAKQLQEALNPLGVMVAVRARHLCMAIRGVKEPDAEMVTTATIGVFKESEEARREFASAVGGW